MNLDKEIKLFVAQPGGNPEEHILHVDPEIPLLWALRDFMNHQEVKFGCGIARCGACTVVVDEKAVRSCVTPVKDVAGKVVTTLKSLGNRESPHPLQRSWLEKNVSQCGYCQPGQILNAHAFLTACKKKAQRAGTKIDVSVERIEKAMSGNICRCGTYPRIISAIQHAAKEY